MHWVVDRIESHWHSSSLPSPRLWDQKHSSKYVDPSEYIKRLAAAQGIDMLNLVKIRWTVQQEMKEQQQNMATTDGMVDQTGQFAITLMQDPSKNPQLGESLENGEGFERWRWRSKGSSKPEPETYPKKVKVV